MKFRNKKTGAVVETVLEQYYKTNSNWEEYVEKKTKAKKEETKEVEPKEKE